MDGPQSATDSGRMTSVEQVLVHFGIKGMRWGVRKEDRPKPSTDSNKSNQIKDKAKVGKVKALSNTELRTAIERMRLEQDYKRLAVNDKPAITRFISSMLLEIGKREVQGAVAKGVAKAVAKKAVTGGLG